MNALLLYVGSIGFACIPPASQTNDMLVSPYRGPFVMDEQIARRMENSLHSLRPTTQGYLMIVRETDPGFLRISCPPIF